MSAENYNYRFTWFSKKLDEYVRSSKSMDEYTFRSAYEHDQGTVPFNYTLLSDIPGLYRSRLARDIKDWEDLSSPQTFSYVPRALCNERFPSLQRANFTGQSVFYASLTPSINFREIGLDVVAGDEVYMAKWKFLKGTTLAFSRIIPREDCSAYNYLREKFNVNEKSGDTAGDYFAKLAKIFMSTEKGSSKYLISALYANFVFNFNPKVISNGGNIKPFDGIIYPSTKVDDCNALNVAIRPESIDRYAILQFVVRGKVAKDLRTIEYTDIGFNHNGLIHWYNPWIRESDIVPTEYFLFDILGNKVDSTNGILRDKDGKIVSNPLAVFEYQKDLWGEKYIRMIPPEMKPDIIIEDLDEAHLSSFTYKGYALLRDVIDWTFVSSDGVTHNIGRIGFNVQVTSFYNRTDKPRGITWL